jgi:two-component system sensor histidine kinase YesM
MNARFARLYGEQAAGSNHQILKQLSYNLNMYLDEIYRLTLMPYYNESIMTELKTRPRTLAGMHGKQRNIETFLIGTMVFPRKDIQRVSIVSDALYFSDRVGVPLPAYEEVRAASWYRELTRDQVPIIILPEGDSRYFSIANVIRDLMDNTQILGLIKVDADYSTIRQLCENVDMGSRGGVVIVSGKNQVVFSSLPRKETGIVLQNAAERDLGEVDMGRIHSQTYLYNAVTLRRFNWQVITVNSLDHIKNVHTHIRRLTILVATIGIFFSSILMYLLMRRFFKRFYSIIGLMKTVEAGNSALRYQGTGTDEIGYLGATMNTMLDRLDSMFKKNAELDKRIYQAQLFHREAQIQLLYSQIRPHFIYNTLNMISILIQQNQGVQAVENINRLSLILHGVAYINKEIPINTELRLVESYLAIHQLRSGDCFTYSINVARELRDYILPALLLQPIVENAVIHSSGDTHRNIHISIYNEDMGNRFGICVRDNGRGIATERLEELNMKIRQDYPRTGAFTADLSSLEGMGLVNVNTRIRMRFGGEYGLNIESHEGTGTVVKVILPRQWKEAENIDTDIDC